MLRDLGCKREPTRMRGGSRWTPVSVWKLFHAAKLGETGRRGDLARRGFKSAHRLRRLATPSRASYTKLRSDGSNLARNRSFTLGFTARQLGSYSAGAWSPALSLTSSTRPYLSSSGRQAL